MNAYISVTDYQACIIHTYIIDKRINLTRKHRIKYETVKKPIQGQQKQKATKRTLEKHNIK